MQTKVLRRVWPWAGLVFCAFIAGCPPSTPRTQEEDKIAKQAREGEYLYAANKLFETDGKLDIRDKVSYPGQIDYMNPSTQMSNRDLTFQRCKVCHQECGFEAAFDKAHYGTEEWRPRITGQDWAPVVERMRVKEDSFLDEVLAERVYTYLRDETTGKYNEAADTKGALVVEVDGPAPSGTDTGATSSGTSGPVAPAEGGK